MICWLETTLASLKMIDHPGVAKQLRCFDPRDGEDLSNELGDPESLGFYFGSNRKTAVITVSDDNSNKT